jgi:hypothetical protein
MRLTSGMLAFCGFAILLASCGGSSSPEEDGGSPSTDGQTVTVSYTADTQTIFANPERGFYHHTEAHSDLNGALTGALTESELRSFRTGESVTLILRFWYLEHFKGDAISEAYLRAIGDDFDAIRRAGIKAIVRFGYTMNDAGDDATKAQVLAHIAQLAPILRANSDVIAAAHAGFIGAWGEWYYSNNFGEGDPDALSEEHWTDRQEVLTALLEALPASRTVALRTPAFKQHFYGTAPLAAAEAFSGSDASRVGHHDDCFMDGETDAGTYQADGVAADKAYLAQENLYVPQGGETCAVVEGFSDWVYASADMAALHFSYLNADYNTAVLSRWGSANLDSARRKLGYRLALEEGTYAKSVRAGGELAVSLTVRNDGWAPPFNPRALRLILRESSSGAVYSLAMSADPRLWLPGATATVSEKIRLTSVPAGTYDLLLYLPDPELSLTARAEYAVRLANRDMWEPVTGYNRLGYQLTVTP